MRINIKAIQVWRALAGLTVKEMLQKASVPPGTWSVVQQRKEAGPKTIEKLAAALGCDVTDITE